MGLSVLCSAALVLAACSAGSPPASPSPPVAKAAPASRGLDPGDMDTSAKACVDFYQYGNGGWTKKNPIPADYPSWGAFNELEERNREILHQTLEKLSSGPPPAAGTEERKLADFYASCMDEAAIEKAGISPLQDELGRIAGIRDRAALQAEISRLQQAGVNALFLFGSEEDRKNSSQVIAAAVQGGLGLPDRDYYTKTDEESKTLRAKYVAHVTKMLALAGDTPATAQQEATAILALETKLAEPAMTRVERRNPDNTYHPYRGEELAKLTPNFSWPDYLRAGGISASITVNVWQPKFFEAASKLLESEPLSLWKTYLRWQLVNAAAPSLSKAFVDEDFDFNQKTLQGTEENLPRWKRCVAATDQALGMALGKIYVRDHFPPQARERADRMVKNLVAALRDDLGQIPWMGAETRKAALAKLDAFAQKIGYPSRWRDYSTLEITRGPYAGNVLAATVFESRRDLAKVGKPVDRTDWEMSPPTVNAYYQPARNEIVFPAGILQPPFFNAEADDAVNYGGIGAVIGHEMTHGFDDSGRKFDAQGNQREWWTPEDLKNYESRAKCVEKQFDAYVVEGDLHENGKLVLGESIADLGGVAIAHRAFVKSLEGKPAPPPIDGLTADQRFFLSWARIWATNDRPEFAKLLTNTNPHPLGRFRAIAPPSNLAEFEKAFSCKSGNPMVRAERCEIW
ncbi:MAG TPA: M13 family metallopeptidase [Thermoanaerobaculia bacterium]|nr:M13 family metallopeptidase [Thermoanaerobaculia bacterium]